MPKGLAEVAEEMAYMHITEPDLIVPGSSDVQWAARQTRMQWLREQGKLPLS